VPSKGPRDRSRNVPVRAPAVTPRTIRLPDGDLRQVWSVRLSVCDRGGGMIARLVVQSGSSAADVVVETGTPRSEIVWRPE
jgi:hypothetical protein